MRRENGLGEARLDSPDPRGRGTGVKVMSPKSLGGADPERDAHRGEAQQAVSYLVRFWLEPREEAGEPAPLRGYTRDLLTGEERYFNDPKKFVEHVLRRLRAERRAESSTSETVEIADMVG